MSSRLLFTLLFRHSSRWQIALILLGSWLGFLLLLVSLQCFVDFRKLLADNTDLVKSAYLVVNKKVGVLNSLNPGSTAFTETEIQDLNKQPFVEKVGGFVLNRFRAAASMHINLPGAEGMYMDLFFEAVSDDFLDLQPEQWHWHSGEAVPMILPYDFLHMYNFNYAPSHGLPQLSEGTLKLVTFAISVQGNGMEGKYSGFIAGFSHRISSILVPLAFLQETNSRFAPAAKAPPQRIMVKALNDQMSCLQTYLDSKGYETNTELMRNGKFSGFVYNALWVLAVAGLLVVLVSLTGFVQYSQLLVSKSRYQLEVLSMLGYSPAIPSRFYTSFFALSYSVIWLLSTVCLWVLKLRLSAFLLGKGIELSGGISALVLLSGAVAALVLLAANHFNTRRWVWQAMK